MKGKMMLNLNDDCRVTDTHVYFLSGPFSQWYNRQMIIPFNGRDQIFYHCEQYMMASKALLFDDQETLDLILKEKSPAECKKLGRKVKKFDISKWQANARNIVTEGNRYKFRNHEDLKEYILSTGNRKLVEAAHYDPVWGVGLSQDDDNILFESNWKGTNWLGQCLMTVREELI